MNNTATGSLRAPEGAWRGLYKQQNKAMRIQYMSDLHMEFEENCRYIKQCGFPVTGEVLVLAGDIFYLKN